MFKKRKKYVVDELHKRWDKDIKDKFGDDMKKEDLEFHDYREKLGLPEFDSDIVFIQHNQFIEFYFEKIKK